MSDFDELEGRIASALDRIGQGAKAIEAQAIAAAEQAAQMTVAPEVDPEEIDLLKKQLEDERLANAQLETRLNTIRDRQEASAKKHRETVSHLNEQVTGQFKALSDLDIELQRLRAANALLRQSNAALRQATDEGEVSAHLINEVMRAELDSLRAERMADRAEVAALVDSLTPMVENRLNKLDAKQEGN
ncbi:MAG: hypothetical protein MK160_09275 [Rhodobacteraceae bacterium]|nr:hypothetical protein [Paracoccaceae bacterium]